MNSINTVQEAEIVYIWEIVDKPIPAANLNTLKAQHNSLTHNWNSDQEAETLHECAGK